MRSALINFLLILISLCLTLAVSELGFRGFQYMGLMEDVSRDSVDKGATPNRHLNARMRRSDNETLFMEYRPNDPNINNVGHRGFDFQLDKPANTLRIALLGDSVGYGYSVPFEETFAMRLQQQLGTRAQQQFGVNIELYNFSVSGYSTVAEAELYRVKVRPYQPDFVLLAYVLNDPMPASMVVMSVGAARKQADQFAKLVAKSQLLGWASLQWQQFRQVHIQKQNYRDFYQGELWQQSQQAIAQLAADTTADQAPMAGVIFPLLLDFSRYPFAAEHEKIQAMFAAKTIPSLDLLPRFSQENHLALRPHPKDDTHPNSLGHQIAADQIETWLWPQLVPLLEKMAADNQAAIGTPE